MIRLTVLGLLFGALAALPPACGASGEEPTPVSSTTPRPQDPSPTTKPSPERSTAVANPASVACAERGGEEKTLETPAGQSGVCVFADGSRCDSWRLFRGECVEGSCHAEDGQCD